MRALLLLAVLISNGCIAANMTAGVRLQEAAAELNDGLRWNRMDVALDHVDDSYRGRFVRIHHRWTRELQIADTELLSIQVGSGNRGPTSIVAVRWFSEDSTILERAVIHQRWRRSGNDFLLLDEQVREGNRSLLAVR